MQVANAITLFYLKSRESIILLIIKCYFMQQEAIRSSVFAKELHNKEEEKTRLK